MEDKFRIKAIKAFIIFLAAMFVMTFAARVIYSEKLPKVTAQKAEIRRLSHSIKCSGTVEGVEKIPVYTEEGLRVAEVPAKNGSKVIKGDVLIRLDTKYLAEKIQLLEKEIAADIEKPEEYVQKIYDLITEIGIDTDTPTILEKVLQMQNQQTENA